MDVERVPVDDRAAARWLMISNAPPWPWMVAAPPTTVPPSGPAEACVRPSASSGVVASSESAQSWMLTTSTSYGVSSALFIEAPRSAIVIDNTPVFASMPFRNIN